MMKIQIHEAPGEIVLSVEGRLAGLFVPELEQCWLQARAQYPASRISVNLRYVTCVDREGRRLLQAMHRSGVPFLGARLATQDILEQIMEHSPCDC